MSEVVSIGGIWSALIGVGGAGGSIIAAYLVARKIGLVNGSSRNRIESQLSQLVNNSITQCGKMDKMLDHMQEATTQLTILVDRTRKNE